MLPFRQLNSLLIATANYCHRSLNVMTPVGRWYDIGHQAEMTLPARFTGGLLTYR